MNVRLISHTPNPDELCSEIAQVCYSDKKFDEIKANTKLLRNVIDSGHLSVIEHANFTFVIECVSRVTTHQLVRHRIASYSQQSQRYVKMEDTVCKLPSSVELVVDGDSDANNAFIKLNESLDENIETTTVEPKEPCLISTTDYVMQENKRLKKCIMLLVSYLDALVKARSKLADIERMLKE